MLEDIILIFLLLATASILWIVPASRFNNGNWIIAFKTFPLGVIALILSTKLLNALCADEYIPVISSVGTDEFGQSYNINADTAAAAVATALKAEKLIFLTDIDGVRSDPDDPASLFAVLSTEQSMNLIADGTISGGMIPKVTACVDAIEKGVKRVHIINGTIPHPILLEIFTDKGIGTMFEQAMPVSK